MEGVSSQFSLPDPSGKFKVGTVEIMLTDHNRVDPYAPDSQKRTIMMQVFYPAKGTHRYPVSPYMPKGTAQFENQAFGLPNNTLQSIQTQAYIGAPIAVYNPQVVIFSPALSTTRHLYTSLLSDVASRGYLVVSIDHPYDADVVELPDGKLITGVLGGDLTVEQINEALGVRTQDASFTGCS
ncbi:hypothetical protein K7432_017557 [Basidiobolus ranarum]|uniref:1-alkyl-2-acetylglycerophosphocholine esterase n=1 Tax=Basidiobolus ranarum TaxID=34480 RepID=A0ABR2VLC5_9FUNG